MKIELLDHGYAEVVETWGSDERIIESARMSTHKSFLGWGEESTCDQCAGAGTEERSHGRGPGSLCKPCNGKGKRINVPGDEKLLRHLWMNKHSTPFEFAGLTIEVQAPIVVFREWHRHRVPFGYSELSARYTPLPDVNYVPSIERMMIGTQPTANKQAGTIKGAEMLTEPAAVQWLTELEGVYRYAQEIYERGLKLGVPKELARLPVPVGRYSRMRATGNLRGWCGFLQLRMASGAQWEIRQYANTVHDMLAEAFPRTMALFDETRPT